MNAKKHAVASLLVGLVLAYRHSSLRPVLVSLFVGVGIDFDHFIISRILNDDWKALALVIEDPTLLAADGTVLFSESRETEIFGLEYIILTHAAETLALGWVTNRLGAKRATVETVVTSLTIHTLLDVLDDPQETYNSFTR